ncbi:hypothetical protein [Mycolicibacterium stellerae]|uniref:hypothetical protein n=1 Tax=Mycolicibacterium stellerae TaxID=2358193 RepID=UPI001F28FA03|nr:hypothetical protein [Mycolicibacterium stellerae]
MAEVDAKCARHAGFCHATLDTVNEEPEIYVFDFSASHGAAEYRERLERTRTEARQRYRVHLAAAFDLYGAPDPEALADTALDALTDSKYVDSGERCRCSCHPRLPESDLHDYGFGCVCMQAPEDRRRAFHAWRSHIGAFWRSPEGKQITAAEHAAEAELEAWLAEQPGVVVRSHGGQAPEQWRGAVDGRVFYFRERHGEWRIELNLRPSGRFARALVGTDSEGEPRYEERELDSGDVIADGTTAIDGYGSTPVERAKFIVDTIRVHLSREACALHVDDLSSIEALLGCAVRWCPFCGTRMSTD